ncbi:MAG: hypothetical protein ACJA09_001321 [Alcanivorax sp.]|jgi:hypothetical protein
MVRYQITIVACGVGALASQAIQDNANLFLTGKFPAGVAANILDGIFCV